MAIVQFKFLNGTKIHRFAPDLQGEALLLDIKKRVAELVDKDDYKLFWRGLQNEELLDTEKDLSAALEYAHNAAKKTARPPWVQLSIKSEAAAEAAAAAAAAAVFVPRWLLLKNGGNDCFLNAALQYLRRARDLKSALEKWEAPQDSNKSEKQQAREWLLSGLWQLLDVEGEEDPREFRQCLPQVIGSLEKNFLTSQQDAYEILTKIFDDVIPESVGKKFVVESARKRRCRDNEQCKGLELVVSGPIHYQHIGSMNQIVDLEALLSDEWREVEGENELRHCSACCECCTAAREGHDEGRCEECRGDNKEYVEHQRFQFKGDSEYALVAFNILHESERVDWALAKNCNMDKMKLMGHTWKAVAVIKHIGVARENWSTGHYVCYTREDDNQWWLHDDALTPRPIGRKYRVRSGYSYPFGTTDMQGVLAVLFQKIE